VFEDTNGGGQNAKMSMEQDLWETLESKEKHKEVETEEEEERLL